VTGTLDGLFDPDSIALVGASTDPEKLAGRPLRFLQDYDFGGDLYPVNPGADEIAGTECYDSITDLPKTPDVAMILLPAELTVEAVADCGEMGVPYAIVIASGFSEIGEDGRDREAELVETAQEGDVRLVGPNSEGLLNLTGDVAMSFSSILKRDDLKPGGVSFVTQSGAFGGALFQLSQNRDIGTSKWISTGNESDLSTVDYLDYLVEDSDTDTVVTYVEGIDEGRRLREIGRRAAETDTNIIAMRVGASPAGEAAAASHTGSVATEDDVYQAAFDQAGVTRVRSVDEFVDAISAFETVPSSAFPRTGGYQGIGVVSMSGGAAVLIADTCHRLDFPLATLTAETRETVAAEIPPYGSETNPVDVTAAAISDPEVFNTCIGAMVEDANTSGLIVQFGNSGGDIIEEFKDDMLRFRAENGKAIAAVFTGNPPVESTVEELIEGGIMVFEDPVRSVETMQNLAERGAFLDAQTEQPAPEPGDFDAREPLATDENWGVAVAGLEAEGIDFAASRAVDSADAAVAAATDFGYPVVCKLNPLAAVHKSEVGGVRTGLDDSAAVRAAYNDLAATGDAGVIVQETIEGVEVIAGVTEDPDFGPIMLFGPGGIFVELFEQFAYRQLPITEAEAQEMIAETDAARLLDGFRDRPPGDTDALASTLAAISRAYCRYDVSELELNPVIVTEDGAVAVDLLME
jgi:acyl-CoA synthetase (NDP forming)